MASRQAAEATRALFCRMRRDWRIRAAFIPRHPVAHSGVTRDRGTQAGTTTCFGVGRDSFEMVY